MCVECWADKRGRGRTPFYIRRKAGGDPIDADWLVSAAWWAVGVLVSAVIGVFLYSLNG
jgi:hypothetical protein